MASMIFEHSHSHDDIIVAESLRTHIWTCSIVNNHDYDIQNLVLPISQDFTKWITIYTFFRLEHNFSQDKFEHLVIANLYCLAQLCVLQKHLNR